MSIATVDLPAKLVPVFSGEARYRGAFGGRGSGKTRSFAKMTAVRGYMHGMSGHSGQILCAREHLNSLDESSLEEIKAAIRSVDWLNDYYDIGEKYVRSKDGRISYSFAGLRHNLDSIKSKARIIIAWVDEAEPASENAWVKLIPTVREDDSEIWVTWNPESARSSTNKRYRDNPPEGAKIVELNWRDNPWFPKVLDIERRADKKLRPDIYNHIWEGNFLAAHEGAYFSHLIEDARREGRVGNVHEDPLMETRAYFDIGGTGAKSDATSIWTVQFYKSEIRVLGYYEAQGQPLATHVAWLREQTQKIKTVVLPHDGGTHDKVYSVSYESALRDAGYNVIVVPNQGKGAAGHRVEAVRRILPSTHFNEPGCKDGMEALSWYHEKRDENRSIGLGPNHDWSSHASDAFGMMAVVYEPPNASWGKPLRVNLKGIA
jgi:phage terminase large subunit